MSGETQPKDYSATGLCLGCGYRLCNLPEHRCPECGRWFDPYDPESMRVPGYIKPRPPRPRWPKTFGGEMLLGAILGTLFLIPQNTFATALGIVSWVAIAIRLMGRQARPEPEIPEGPAWRRPVKWMAIASLLLALIPKWYTCPHATTVWLGPVGISYGHYGGPCGQHPYPARWVKWRGNWYLPTG